MKWICSNETAREYYQSCRMFKTEADCKIKQEAIDIICESCYGCEDQPCADGPVIMEG